MNSLSAGFFSGFSWIARLAFLNLLWIVFTLAGLGILGIFPATVAMLTVIRYWLMGEDEIPLTKTFWESFRRDFIKANLLGFSLIAIGGILFVDIKIVELYENVWLQSARIILIGSFWLYIALMIYIFPLFVNFDYKLSYYYKYAVSLIFFYPSRTIVTIAGCSLIYVSLTSFPSLLPFFSSSLISFLIMWNAMSIFSEIEMSKNSQSVSS